MISEIDLLREDIPRLEQTFGTNNLFVAILKDRLDFLQKQMNKQPEDEQNRYYRAREPSFRPHISQPSQPE